MIRLTRLRGGDFSLNAELIERVEATPDTVITLITGRTYVVAEDVDEVLRRIREVAVVAPLNREAQRSVARLRLIRLPDGDGS